MPKSIRLLGALTALFLASELYADEVITFIPIEVNQREDGTVYRVEDNPPEANELHDVVHLAKPFRLPSCRVTCRSNEKHDEKYYVATFAHRWSKFACDQAVSGPCEISPDHGVNKFPGRITETLYRLKMVEYPE